MEAVAATDADGNRPPLTLDTVSGTMVGTWCGSSPVRKGDLVDVELSFTHARRWAEVAAGPEGVPSAHRPDVLTGEVEAVDDTVLVVRIGTAIALLELLDSPPDDAVGRRLRIPVDLEFWPTGL